MALRTETREVSGFSEVAVRGMGEATIVQGDAEGLVIEADETIITRIKSEVRGDRLILGLDLAWWEWFTWWLTWLTMPNKQVRYTVRLRNFTGASISGSGKILAGELRAAACRLGISGSGKVAIEQLTVQAVDLRISGSGDVVMAGHAEKQAVHISGAGSVQTSDLATTDTEIHISGSGKASVNAAKTLTVNISGSGSVFYRGQPQVRQHISGSGRVGAAS